MPADRNHDDPTGRRREGRSLGAWLAALSQRWRRRLAGLGLSLAIGFAVAVLTLVLFAWLAGEVAEQETLALDIAVYSWLQQYRNPALDAAMTAISALGSIGLAIAFIIFLALLVWRRRWTLAIALAIVTFGALALDTILKALFQRARPLPVPSVIPAQAYSFPSGHAMVSASFYLFIAYLGWLGLRGWRRTAWIGGFVLLVLAIGVSRLYLGVHYFTDVVAGYLAGIFWVDAVIIGTYFLPGPPGETDAPSAPSSGASGAARATRESEQASASGHQRPFDRSGSCWCRGRHPPRKGVTPPMGEAFR